LQALGHGIRQAQVEAPSTKLRHEGTAMTKRPQELLGVVLLIVGISPALAQDAENGEEVFKKCRTCHQVGDTAKNSVGPILNGIIGR
jgi:cytochrome c2